MRRRRRPLTNASPSDSLTHSNNFQDMAKKKTKAPRARANAAGSRERETPRTRSAAQDVLIFLFVSLVVAACLHLIPDKFPDPDVFYHFRHAQIYGSSGAAGIFDASFPWLPYSVIGKFASDIWYGFHLLIVPLTWIEDSNLGLRLAGVLVTSAFLMTYYAAALSLKLRPAAFWPFFLIFSSAFLLHRVAMLRPHVLSLALDILLLALLAAGSLRGVFAAALALTFLHLSLFPISILLFGVFAATKALSERNYPWREGLALLAGIAAGWMLRPDPWGAAKIAYIQIFQLTIEKLRGTPLDFGSEILPLSFNVRSNYLPFTVLCLGVILFLLWKVFVKRTPLSATSRTVVCASGALSVIFFVMALLLARRAFDFASGFGVIFIALVFSEFLYRSRAARIALAAVFIFMVVYAVPLRNRALSFGWDPDRFRSVAQWLEANSAPGEIVFNTRWEYFPELFFWNKKNYYTSGMDPIFQYAYDLALYGEARDLSLGNVGRLTDYGQQDPYTVIKEHFKAKYVVVLKPVDARLYSYLSRNGKFSLKHENQVAAVFEPD